MPIIYTYPSVVPKISDLVLLSTTNSDDENITANASIASIKDVIDVVDTFTSSFGTYISGTTNASATGNVNIGSLDLSAVDGTAVIATRFLSKDNTWDVPDFAGSFSTVGLADNSSINYTVKLPNLVGTANQVLKLPSTIGSSPYQLTWGDATGGDTYSAGDGLDLTGTTFSTDLKANGGLVIQSTELAVDLSASAITGTLSESDGGTGASLAATLNNTLIGNGDYFAESGDVETGILLPVGATNRRPTASSTNVGLMRYNSQTANFELCKQTTSSSGEYSWYTIDVTIITE
jgi:hypothetical protein